MAKTAILSGAVAKITVVSGANPAFSGMTPRVPPKAARKMPGRRMTSWERADAQ
jgi:hypothetical protein